MLRDLMDLARLEAGQDTREITTFNAATVLRDLRTVTEPLARERGLEFHIEGPDSLIVEGDASKVRRIGQNLVLNAIKYTRHGSVGVSWGEEGAGSWWLIVKDTGPGLMAGPGAPIVAGLKEATASARESDEIAAEEEGDAATVLAPPPGDSDATRLPARQLSGEGFGLSIVKRLCELLDASLELASSPQSGTTFRVVLPRSYTAASS
jgi:signal transduction histidine kinase